MAKTIATIGGIGLVPGISKNRRWYTPEMVERATGRLAERIRAGNAPASMLSFHGAGDDSREITATLTGSRLDEGRLRFDGAITDTEAGRDIASLADTTDDRSPHLKNVSIRGYWLGTVRKVRGPDGQPVETADDLEIDGIDWTRSPGVTGAEIDTFAWVKDGAAESAETTERVAIYESVQEARVTITEETAPDPAEADAQTPAPAGTIYADPGYLKDKKKRYPLSSPSRVRAAWSYINQKANADQYTPQQLKRIKGKIRAAMGRIGATVAAEGYVIWPAEQASGSAVAEYYDGDAMKGSFSVCASSGPLNISVSSYCIDPADLDLIVRAAADAACKAFAAMDPDMDGDIDVPGADSEDTDHDAGESAPPGEVTEASPPDPAPEPVAEPQEDKEVPVVTDTASAVEASPAAPPLITLTEAQFGELLARSVPQAAAETAPVTPVAPAVTETADERVARLVEERAAARLAAEIPAAVAETEEQRISRLVEARVAAEKQRLVAEGQAVPGRKGLTAGGEVDEHTARTGNAEGEMPAAPPGKSWDEMHKWSTEELNQYATPGLADYVFKGRAARAG